MSLPLHSDAISEFGNLPKSPENANSGLWYDKFCNQWLKDNNKWSLGLLNGDTQNGNLKLDWIKSVSGTVGSDTELEDYHLRRERLITSQQGSYQPYQTTGPFVTGLGLSHPIENGFAWHQTLGVPYLPGSSVKGMVRNWAETWEETDKKEILRIFGSEKNEHGNVIKSETGSVIFLDAVPLQAVQIKPDIMTPHYAEYYQDGEVPGDWFNPTPIHFLVVEQNQTFMFGLILRQTGKVERDEKSTADVTRVKEWLQNALDWIGAGAKTAVGYGRFQEFTPESPGEKWLNDTIKSFEDLNYQKDTIIFGKALAEKWNGVQARALKLSALDAIKIKWGEERWTVPPSRNAKRVKRIYDEWNQ